MVFETKRLYLRELNNSDLEDLKEILQNEKVMYAYEHAFNNEEVNTWFENQQKRYLNNKHGLWAVILKENNEMIGQIGLTLQNIIVNDLKKEVLEIGYLLKEEYWNCGYATEAALGCKQYAFNTLKAEKVYSIIKHDNILSQKVAKKLGMEIEGKFIKKYYNKNMLHYIFSVRNNNLL